MKTTADEIRALAKDLPEIGGQLAMPDQGSEHTLAAAAALLRLFADRLDKDRRTVLRCGFKEVATVDDVAQVLLIERDRAETKLATVRAFCEAQRAVCDAAPDADVRAAAQMAAFHSVITIIDGQPSAPLSKWDRCETCEQPLPMDQRPTLRFDKELAEVDCECGHSHYRHFDGYDDMRPVGCKYCGCMNFRAKRGTDAAPTASAE